MKKNSILLAMTFCLAGVLAGCNGGGNGSSSINSSSSSSSSSSLISSSSSSSSSNSSSKQEVTLAQAIKNTDTYAITSEARVKIGWYFELKLDNFYYYEPYDHGYIVLDEDPGYFHAVSQSIIPDSDLIVYDLNVLGRNGIVADKALMETYCLIDVIEKYVDDFYRISDTTYSSNVAAIGRDLEMYFQSSNLSYTSYYEIDIGNNGEVASLRAYETMGNEPSLSVLFEDIDIEDYLPYQRWRTAGSKIDIRIFDIKYGYGAQTMDGEKYVSVYENEELTISGTVSSIDSEGNYYIANNDQNNGPVGIKVVPADNNLPEINQIVSVKGTILTDDDFAPYFNNAVYTVVGEDAYTPVYDEETLVDRDGGGVYALNLFAQAPYFSNSVYSTFAYIFSAPATNIEGADTEIELVCPSINSFRMKLILPKGLSTTFRNDFLTRVKEAGIYLGSGTGIEMSIQNVLIRFDNAYDYRVILEVTEYSSISRRLSAQEKIYNSFGISDFPLPQGRTVTSFRFGGATGLFIEEYYGKTSNTTRGIYLSFSATEEELPSYIDSFVNTGFELVQQQRDVRANIHRIYQQGDVILDFLYEASFGGGVVVYIWMYEGDLVYNKTIKEQVANGISWFNVEDFVVLDGTYESNYTYFELLNFAGRNFTEENPLHCITLDLNEDRFTDLRRAYADKGYSQARTSTNTIYTYTTRGSNHYVYQKAVEGTDQKIYIDMALYPTSDYCYYGHDQYTHRIEIMIYQATEPLSTVYETDLTAFSNEVQNVYGADAAFDISLPAGCRVERIENLENYGFLDYGYYYVDEAFVYGSDLSAIKAAVVSGLEASGYELFIDGTRGDVYSKECPSAAGFDNTSCILVMQENTRGYVRLINFIGGNNFLYQ